MQLQRSQYWLQSMEKVWNGMWNCGVSGRPTTFYVVSGEFGELE